MAHTYHDTKDNRDRHILRRIRLNSFTRKFRRDRNTDTPKIVPNAVIGLLQRVAHDSDREGRFNA